MWLVNGSWLAMTSRKSYTLVRGWGTSIETVTGLGVMYQTVHYVRAPKQPPRPTARQRHHLHLRAGHQRPLAARAGDRDRDEPSHAHPPLRLQGAALGRGRRRRRAAAARRAPRAPPRSRCRSGHGDAHLVAAHLRSRPVAERAAVLRALWPGPPGPAR